MDGFVIFVSGLLASGKTALSEYLSKELGVLVINKDYIKEILCEAVGFANRDENKKLSGATHQLMRHIARNSMKIGSPIILESNFDPDDGEYFEGEIRKYGYKAVTITLTGDKRVLYERFMKRWEDRHWAHKSFQPSWDAFNNQQEAWVSFEISGQKLIVDTTDFKTVRYDEILNKVRGLINS